METHCLSTGFIQIWKFNQSFGTRTIYLFQICPFCHWINSLIINIEGHGRIIWNWYQIQPIFFRVPYQKVYQLLVVWFYLNQLISQLWSFALFARSKRLCCMCARFQQSGIKVGLGFERGWGWNFMAFLTFGTSSTCERGSVAGWQMCRDTGESQDICGWNNKQMSLRCQILSVGSFLSSCKRRSQEVESPNLSWKRIVTDSNQSISSTISSPSFKFVRRVCLL